jgi:hypothetical protein
MKIKEIANNIELHKAEDGLALMSLEITIYFGIKIRVKINYKELN